MPAMRHQILELRLARTDGHYALLALANRMNVMPHGPKGEKRPADVIGAAVMVAESQRAKSRKPAVSAPPIFFVIHPCAHRSTPQVRSSRKRN